MFLTMLLVAGAIGALQIGVWGYRQAVAIREIERLGGTVEMEPIGPAWLLELVDPAWLTPFQPMWAIHLENTQATDVTLQQIGCLTATRSVELKNTNVSDAGLAHLSEMRDLFLLDLSSTRVTGSGLVHLKRMNELTLLSLSDTRVGDTSLIHLKDLTRLEALILSGSHVTDQGLVYLKGLARLETLELWRTEVTGAGLSHIAGLSRLDHASLALDARLNCHRREWSDAISGLYGLPVLKLNEFERPGPGDLDYCSGELLFGLAEDLLLPKSAIDINRVPGLDLTGLGGWTSFAGDKKLSKTNGNRIGWQIDGGSSER